MSQKLSILILLALLALPATAQKNEERPILVVGIVVDQMRYDYLTRFWDRYGNDGFKKLVNQGFSFRNNHFNYVPTYTGPGHASVYTGTSPMNHGIIGNDWYNKFEEQMVYCVQDDEVSPVGTKSKAGKMSPHRLKTTTVADQNRIFTQMRGKTIGVALKDRGAILPAGHTANAAYWFHGEDEGNWISSSFYLTELPKWVKDFNKSDIAESYLTKWETLYDIETYTESGSDENEFEGGFKGKKKATFPYDLKALSKKNNGFDILKNVAFGNDLTTDFALAAIEGEQLGQGSETDFLTLSYSSTDYVGHNFGVNSKEAEDTYLRLDKNIAELLNFLEKKVGQGNFTVFLTADHGGVDVPAYLKSLKIPAGYFDHGNFRKTLDDFLKEEFGAKDLIENISNGQVFFDHSALGKADVDAEDLEKKLATFILGMDQIEKVMTRTQLESANFEKGLAASLQNGFNQKRSGDVIFVLDPATIIYSQTGSTHGSGFTYDTHVPLIFYGKGVRTGSSTERSEIVDIAPSLAALLGISLPNGSTGKILSEMLEE